MMNHLTYINVLKQDIEMESKDFGKETKDIERPGSLKTDTP